MKSIEKFLNSLDKVACSIISIPWRIAQYYREKNCEHVDDVITDFYTGCSKCGYKEIW